MLSNNFASARSSRSCRSGSPIFSFITPLISPRRAGVGHPSSPPIFRPGQELRGGDPRDPTPPKKMLHTNLAIVWPQRKGALGGVNFQLANAKMKQKSRPNRQRKTNHRHSVSWPKSLFFISTAKKPGLTLGPANSKNDLLKPPPAPRGDLGWYRRTSAPQTPPALQPVSRPGSARGFDVVPSPLRMRSAQRTGDFVLRLAAFADEISPDLDEQIRVCAIMA